MSMRITGARVFQKGKLVRRDIALEDGRIIPISQGAAVSMVPAQGLFLFPGLVDVHVHLREPGFFLKETIDTGTRAAARGGYTAVCAMPNLNPPPDCAENIDIQLGIIQKTAHVRVYPYGCLTMGQRGAGECCDYVSLRGKAVAFSDDGRGVQDESTMRFCMEKVKAIDGLVCAHCEDNTLLFGGVIHGGAYARAHGHKGICSESEWRQVKRDLRIAKETGCRYHVCHVSCKESVALIRQAKREGVDVTCETAPHYLILCQDDLQEDGRFKMNPPLRDREDRDALIEGLLDGTIDIIATDHAPHTLEEKSRGLDGSLMGVVGLECALPMLNAHLVKPGLVPLEIVLAAMTDAPRARFRLPPMTFETGQEADMTLFDLEKEVVIDPDTFLSKGRATAFQGMRGLGQCRQTIVGGETVWKIEK